jgi:hypothetical protein
MPLRALNFSGQNDGCNILMKGLQAKSEDAKVLEVL